MAEQPGLYRRRQARMIEWGLEHPVLDASLFGPILLVGLLYFRAQGVFDLALIWCLAIGLAATGLGALMGLRRKRILQCKGLRSP